jgi:hypothetical protein
VPQGGRARLKREHKRNETDAERVYSVPIHPYLRREQTADKASAIGAGVLCVLYFFVCTESPMTKSFGD